MNQSPMYSGGPLWGIIKFLAIIGLITIFGSGIVLGVVLATGTL